VHSKINNATVKKTVEGRKSTHKISNITIHNNLQYCSSL